MQLRKGLTLIEMLVVVLILAALMAVIVPRITKATYKANENACGTNIDTINMQVEYYRVTSEGDAAILSDVTGDLDLFPEGPPVCPKEGTYSLSGENRAVCDHISGGGC